MFYTASPSATADLPLYSTICIRAHVLPEIVCTSLSNVKNYAKIYQGFRCVLVFKKNGFMPALLSGC